MICPGLRPGEGRQPEVMGSHAPCESRAAEGWRRPPPRVVGRGSLIFGSKSPRVFGVLTVAFTNQKGGVGKTSTVACIAAALDHMGKRVLCIDLDPQADLTTWLGLDPFDDDQYDAGDVLYNAAEGGAAKAIQRAGWGEQLCCIGSNLDLAEREQDRMTAADFRLRTSLEGVSGFDVVLIDCPPSIGHLVTMALVAATHVVVVTEPSAGSLRGVENVMNTTEVVSRHYNKPLRLAGIIVNGQDNRTSESILRSEQLAGRYGDQVWGPPVPHRAVVAKAFGARASLYEFGADAKQVTPIYEALAQRVLDLGEDA